ncbi:hypothetical protein N7497_006126 [Penicillium chrysogenum]|nr:hypothetical protein N7497_006126 [Penicillium chrysogenum]
MSRVRLLNLNLPASKAKVFYRQAGQESAPVILLLHGFPSSSHQYRNLIPILAKKYRVLAPDLPGFGFTTVQEGFKYTFDSLAAVVSEFLDRLSVTRFSIYIFDYGAPTGLRLALQRPNAVQAIISQNGNAYYEGLGGAFWDQVRDLWNSNNDSKVRAKLASGLLSFEATKWHALVSRMPSSIFFGDYRTNLPLYPKFQEYFRQSNVPVLVAWGKNDQIFVPPGAEAFKRDLPKAEVHLLDAGHFAVETETEEMGSLIFDFLGRNGI